MSLGYLAIRSLMKADCCRRALCPAPLYLGRPQPLNRGRLGFSNCGIGCNFVHRRRLDRANLELSVWQRHSFARFVAKEGLTDRGLIRNDVSIRIAVPGA